MKQHKYWIDAVKAICMMAVYLMHSQVYYGTGGINYGYALRPFYVNGFFFISGYLFFNKYSTKGILTDVKWGGVLAGNKKHHFQISSPYYNIFSHTVYSQSNVS